MTTQNTSQRWCQVNLWCDHWQAAEMMAVHHLRPLLADAERSDRLASWWFVRKAESWRVRFALAHDADEAATAFADQIATTLYGQGAIRRHAYGAYEPEIEAFGGAGAMDIAHVLFHHDSRYVLDHLARHQDHRRELAVLLASHLLRAAGQDWYEQGDIWARLAAHRGAPGVLGPSARTVVAVQRLITAAADTYGSPLHAEPAWRTAFDHAGKALADLNQHSALTRGLRAVLTHHLLFAFNRLGVSAEHQYLLATSASQVIFHQDPRSDYGSTDRPSLRRPTTVGAVTTDTTDILSPDPADLRAALVDHIRGRGTFRTPEVETAFLTVPRHLFLPGVDPQEAYSPKVVVTKRADNGTAISSASAPNLVAEMLEQLEVQPGHRVLEIGAATGINAALMAELVGPTGHVVTIELDDDLAAGARAGLDAAGYAQVEVICRDGALGHAVGALYDRIVVTAGAWDIANAWWRQLAIGGRLVAPLRMHGSGLTRSIAFDLQKPGQMTSASALVCGFVPMRGLAEHAEAFVQLSDDVVLHVDATDSHDRAALSNVLTYPTHTHWTGIHVRDSEPIEHLDLWLLTTSGNNFGRLSVGPVARSSGLANPARRWAGAAIYDGGTIAYLAMNDLSDDESELGVIAHGPDSAQLVARLTDLLHQWRDVHSTQPNIVARQVRVPTDRLSSGARVVRPNSELTVSW
jgi:protein-L-isoaspartate(D-aspartate) O-methyltransferase